MASSQFNKPIVPTKKLILFTSQTIAANSAKELFSDKGDIESYYECIIGGCQIYSMSPQTGNLVVRAIRVATNNQVYVYVYNHSNSSITFNISVDVLCFN